MDGELTGSKDVRLVPDIGRPDERDERKSAWMTRRQLLSGAAVSSAAALVAACSSTSSGGQPGTSGSAKPGTTFSAGTIPDSGPAGALGAGSFQLLSQSDMNFQALFALGSAGLSSEVGEVITAVNQANAAPGGASFQSFFDAFVAMGNQVAGWADEAVNKGRKVTARSQLLRVAQYYDQALFFVLGTSAPSAEQAVFQKMDDAWSKAASLMDPPLEKVSIPYEGSNLPAWFVKAPGAGKRPTVILNNGSDAQNVDLWAYGAQAALERGYHSLILTGPGQGEMLFVRKIPFRPDWEKVITPVVDYLLTRPEVDERKIGLTGWSFGGVLVARAAAFEKRLAAVCSDPGLINPFTSYPPSVQKTADGDEKRVNGAWNDGIVKGANPDQTFDLKKRLEIYTTEALTQARAGKVPTDWYAISRAVKAFDVTPVVGQITTPYLVTQYEGDASFPGGGQQLYDALKGPKTFVNFTTAEGAQFHDAPMAPQRRNEVVFDWLGDTFGT